MTRQPEEKTDPASQDNNGRSQHHYLNKNGRPIISAASLRKLPVQNRDGRDLGVLKDLMIETERGTAAYAILLFENDKSFALPFTALDIDLEAKKIYIDIQHEVFSQGTGMEVPDEV